jgi:hypothetical protein
MRMKGFILCICQGTRPSFTKMDIFGEPGIPLKNKNGLQIMNPLGFSERFIGRGFVMLTLAKNENSVLLIQD